MRFKPISNEVWVAVDPIVKIGREEIEWLKQNLAKAPRGRVRICAHPHPSNLLHEMIIALAQRTYIRPHKHLNKSESFHVIEGAVDVVVLDDQGRISDLIPLGDPGSGRDFFYRLATPVYHTLLIRSEGLVIHETTGGPFVPDSTVYAPWSPPETDAAAAQSFMGALAKAVAEFVQTSTHEPGRAELPLGLAARQRRPTHKRFMGQRRSHKAKEALPDDSPHRFKGC